MRGHRMPWGAFLLLGAACSLVDPSSAFSQPVALRGSVIAAPGVSARLADAVAGSGLVLAASAWPGDDRAETELQTIAPLLPASTARSTRPGDGLSPWYAPVLSAVVPGAGQGLLRQQRGVAYLAAESYLILQLLQSQRDFSREKREYLNIARTVARAGVPGDRPDGPWSYYERMQRVLESGAYNRTPGAGFTPESDPETFNGSIWLLARETYWLDPEAAPEASSAEYQRALNFYQSRAATDEFLWSWRDAQLQQDLFRQTIARSNESARRRRQMVGLLLANHALSLVDAYVSVRLRVFGTDPASGVQQFGVSGTIPMPSRRR